MSIFNIGIIGCGLIGFKRALSIGKKGKLIACSDVNKTKLSEFSKKFKILGFSNWEKIVEMKEVDIVIVATPHHLLSKITLKSLKNKKHVFVEKPGAINFKELNKIIKKQKQYNKFVYVGYNHRFHPSIIKAQKMIQKGILGELMYLRARYGHGGRLGYENEWRAKYLYSGGGEIIDQGSHLIDLSSLFFGNFIKVKSIAKTFFWKMKVEDNGFMILENKDKKIAFLHASCTEWKNMFSMEIFGKAGKLEINGLGGSYGIESLTYYKMSSKMGPPKITKWNFVNKKNNSWNLEINNFFKILNSNNFNQSNLIQSLHTLKIINKIYKDNKYDYST